MRRQERYGVSGLPDAASELSEPADRQPGMAERGFQIFGAACGLRAFAAADGLWAFATADALALPAAPDPRTSPALVDRSSASVVGGKALGVAVRATGWVSETAVAEVPVARWARWSVMGVSPT
jgi:hypothetical protein